VEKEKEFLSSLAVVSEEEVCSLELFGSTAGRNESHAGSE
jgi:predicted nucleotidyltransferase